MVPLSPIVSLERKQGTCENFPSQKKVKMWKDSVTSPRSCGRLSKHCLRAQSPNSELLTLLLSDRSLAFPWSLPQTRREELQLSYSRSSWRRTSHKKVVLETTGDHLHLLSVWFQPHVESLINGSITYRVGVITVLTLHMRKLRLSK